MKGHLSTCGELHTFPHPPDALALSLLVRYSTCESEEWTSHQQRPWLLCWLCRITASVSVSVDGLLTSPSVMRSLLTRRARQEPRGMKKHWMFYHSCPSLLEPLRVERAFKYSFPPNVLAITTRTC
ncbi:hypothetical protein MRB53_038360 [Persea americana]|nr:hypothetical protein MRB53_038360 [Persea americana]